MLSKMGFEDRFQAQRRSDAREVTLLIVGTKGPVRWRTVPRLRAYVNRESGVLWDEFAVSLHAFSSPEDFTSRESCQPDGHSGWC
jgi:hypothetical protein